MTLKDFELKLKLEIHPDLQVIPHPTNLDMAGVYFRKAYLCGMPSNNIYEDKKSGYTDMFGIPHVTIHEVEGKVRHFLKLMQEDSEIFELLAMPDKNL